MNVSLLSKAAIWLSCILLPILATPVRAVDSAQRAAQLGPYMDDQTISVIGLQPQAIDLDAILKRSSEIDVLKSQAELFQELAGRVRQPLDSLRNAKAEVYLLIRLGSQSVPELDVVAFVPREADREPIAKLFRSLNLQAVEVSGDRVLGTTAIVPKAFAQTKGNRTAELAPALAAAGNSPLQCLLIPSRDHRRVLSEMMPKLPAELGGGDGAAAANLVWGALNVDLQPKLEARIILQTSDATAASRLKGMLGSLVRALIKSSQPSGTVSPITDSAERLIPEVHGDQLLLTLNEQNQRWQELSPLIHGALQKVQQKSDRVQHFESLRQLVLAMHIYHDKHSQFPAAATKGPNGQPLLSWRVQLLPYIGQESLYKQFHLDEPWDSVHNRTLVASMPTIFAPANLLLQRHGKTTFVVPTGDKTVFPQTGGLKINKIRDGTSNTLMIVSVTDQHAVVWTKPDDVDAGAADYLQRLTAGRDGFSAAVCDGSVRFISSTITPEVLRLLTDPDDGQAVPNF